MKRGPKQRQITKELLEQIEHHAARGWLTSTFFIGHGAAIWHGANDNATENTWVWDNGTTSGDNGLTDDLCGTASDCRDSNATWADGTEKWNTNEPNQYQGIEEDCANITRSDGTWNDLSCIRTLYGIFEFD